jgi:hypothetical protein
VFVGFEWSGQSKVSEQLVEQWEKSWLSEYQTGLFVCRLAPDETPFVNSWVAENAQSSTEGMEGGFGSLVWLRNGRAIQYVRYAAKAGADRLSSLTKEAFGN